MKRLLCSIFLLTALLMPVTLIAEGQQETNVSATGEVKVIKSVLDRILIEDDGLKQWLEAYKSQTGVQLDVVKPPHNQYSQILGTTFAAGDLPDICEIQTADYLIYAKSGKLVPLDEYIKNSTALKSIPAKFYEAYRAKDGHIYGFPTYSGGGCVTFLRKDWLDKLDLDVPKTWDEFYKVLKAFTFNDPDGNGKNDTVGMTIPFSVPPSEFDYYNRFIMQDAWFDFTQKKGKWVDGFSEPEMVKALQRWQALYAEGVIDKEFLSMKTSAARSKIYEGQAGVMEYWAGTWAERFQESAQNTNPKANVIPIHAIAGSVYINRVGPCFGITVKAKNPALVFDKIINHMWDKGTGQMLWTFGVENLHYKMENNKIVMLPQLTNPDRPFNKSFIDFTLNLNDFTPPIHLNARTAASIEIHRKDSLQLNLPEGGDVYIRNIGELMTLKQEVFSKIVVKEYSVEEGLKFYKEKAAALQIARILEELNSK